MQDYACWSARQDTPLPELIYIVSILVLVVLPPPSSALAPLFNRQVGRANSVPRYAPLPEFPCVVSISCACNSPASFHQRWSKNIDARLALLVSASGSSSPSTLFLFLRHSRVQPFHPLPSALIGTKRSVRCRCDMRNDATTAAGWLASTPLWLQLSRLCGANAVSVSGTILDSSEG